jgi:hypothetical protein
MANPDKNILPARQTECLRLAAESSPILAPILNRWSGLALPDCWLAGGAIAQTVWNAAFGFAPGHGLADVDLVYYDADDLSADGEARHAARIRTLFPDFPLPIDVKNEARVHLWYAAKFGDAIAPYRSSADAIRTFLTMAGAVGIQPDATGLRVLAPFRLSDLLNGIVRPNKVQITRAIYEAKTARWRTCWPMLTILDWRDDGCVRP